MKKLWQKNWKLDTQVEAFETGDDLLLDQQLVWADIAGSIAHAKMLGKIGLLNSREVSAATQGLLAIQKLNQTGKFTLKAGDEDIHTKIENYLTKEYGQIGKKIHTGRSRNDQVLTALRLYTKYEVMEIWKTTLLLIQDFMSFAKLYEAVPMPGYTHMQKAMPSTVGLWAGAFAESLLDDTHGLNAAYALVDQSPLGSAAGYGVPLALDRAYTASLLGFSSVQNNSMYCQNSRGKTEAAVVASLVSIAQTINKFASDILLFTTNEFGFFTVSDALTTGSSIMPQKKNVDIAELLRSKVHVLVGNYTSVVGISTNLPSGYNRDLQDTKKPLMESLKITKTSLVMTTMLLSNLKPNVKKLHAAMTPELFATHAVLAKVKKGVAFRAAYKSVSDSFVSHSSTLETADLSKAYIQQSTHLGGTGNLGLSLVQTKLAAWRTRCLNASTQFHTALRRLGVDPVSTG